METTINRVLKKFILIETLNITDIAATLFLIQVGFCVEANVFMQNIVQSPVFGVIVKTLVPAILLYVVFQRIKLATEEQMKWVNILTNVGAVFYILINCTHIIWISMWLSN